MNNIQTNPVMQGVARLRDHGLHSDVSFGLSLSKMSVHSGRFYDDGREPIDVSDSGTG